jgi:hypothetical protein
MASPINGFSNPQVALANTFQPTRDNNQLRPEDSRRQDNLFQARNDGQLRSRSSQNDQGVNFAGRVNQAADPTQTRGTLLDITV